MANGSRKFIIPLQLVLVRLDLLEYSVWFWMACSEQMQRNRRKVQQSVTKMVRGLEHVICVWRMREGGFFSLKMKLRGNVIAACNNMLGELER